MVGIVCTISPICSRYRIVVLPLRVVRRKAQSARLEPRPDPVRARAPWGPDRLGKGRRTPSRAQASISSLPTAARRAPRVSRRGTRRRRPLNIAPSVSKGLRMGIYWRRLLTGREGRVGRAQRAGLEVGEARGDGLSRGGHTRGGWEGLEGVTRRRTSLCKLWAMRGRKTKERIYRVALIERSRTPRQCTLSLPPSPSQRGHRMVLSGLRSQAYKHMMSFVVSRDR